MNFFQTFNFLWFIVVMRTLIDKKCVQFCDEEKKSKNLVQLFAMQKIRSKIMYLLVKTESVLLFNLFFFCLMKKTVKLKIEQQQYYLYITMYNHYNIVLFLCKRLLMCWYVFFSYVLFRFMRLSKFLGLLEKISI